MDTKMYELALQLKEECVNLSDYIGNNPELGLEETKACQAYVDMLKKHNFEIEENYLNYPTAFKAIYDSKKEGPSIAYLAEYDALPSIGHGCGHNILGATSAHAALLLSKYIDEIGGKVYLFGTPAEETNGLKVDMVKENAFDNIDVAMMAHPSDCYEESGSSLALEPLQFDFSGKTAHAATAPEKGINALDACIQTFNNFNALREHILPTARVHGIITNGGEAANIVPDKASAQFYIRSTTIEYNQELKKKLVNCAKAGALASGASMKYFNYEKSYKNLITNKALSNLFTSNLKDLGIVNICEATDSPGSLDLGDVSQVCPSIHPYFSICKDKKYAGHTTEFRDCTFSEYAHQQMMKTGYTLAKTGRDIIENAELLKNIREEFENR